VPARRRGEERKGRIHHASFDTESMLSKITMFAGVLFYCAEESDGASKKLFSFNCVNHLFSMSTRKIP
jgi:hypothetical protein